MSSYATIILRSQETRDKPHHIDPDIKTIPGDEVCVLYIGGSGTTDDETANGNAKIIDQEIPVVIFNDIPIYSVVYHFSDPNDNGTKARTKHVHTGDNQRFGLHKYIYPTQKNINYKFKKEILPIFLSDGQFKPFNEINLKHFTIYISDNDIPKILVKKLFTALIESQYTTAEKEKILSQFLSQISFENPDYTNYINDIFNKALLPRISENDKRLPLKIAMKRIRKINIVSHCHGAYVAQKLEEMLQQKMRQMGYSESEINQILSQLLIVAHAPAYKPKKSKTHFLGFVSAFDYFTFSTTNYVTQYIKKHRMQDAKYMFDNEISEIEHKWLPNGPIFLGGAAGNLFLIARGFKFSKQSDGSYGPHPDEHKNTNYTKLPDQNEQGFILNQIAKNVLQNGIMNSVFNSWSADHFIPLPDNSDLIKYDNEVSKSIRPFQDMERDGKKFIKHIYDLAKEYIKSLNSKKSVINLHSQNTNETR